VRRVGQRRRETEGERREGGRRWLGGKEAAWSCGIYVQEALHGGLLVPTQTTAMFIRGLSSCITWRGAWSKLPHLTPGLNEP
jgi:hypothetical protein